jgi:citrate lyase gamma subunit
MRFWTALNRLNAAHMRNAGLSKSIQPSDAVELHLAESEMEKAFEADVRDVVEKVLREKEQQRARTS